MEEGRGYVRRRKEEGTCGGDFLGGAVEVLVHLHLLHRHHLVEQAGLVDDPLELHLAQHQLGPELRLWRHEKFLRLPATRRASERKNEPDSVQSRTRKVE
eukprot:1716961-Rhodomonas_salina.4